MKRILNSTIVTMVLVGLFSVSAYADVGPEDWTGGAQACFGSSSQWSNDNNWESGVAPTSGNVRLSAIGFCDPCTFVACISSVCVRGPRNGESCTLASECACPNGSIVAEYDRINSMLTETYGRVTVEASSTDSMTLRKTADRNFEATTGIFLEGDTTKKAILDANASGFQPTFLDATGAADIDIASGVTVSVSNTFSTGGALDSTMTIKGSGLLDAANTVIKSTATGAEATLVLDGDVNDLDFNIGTLKILGGATSSELARFHDKSAFSIGDLNAITMQGQSEIDVDRSVDYAPAGNNTLTVDTNGAATQATIKMVAGQKLSVGNVNVTAGATDAATLTISTGILESTGIVTIDGTSTSAKATLVIASTADAPTLENVKLEDWGVFDSQRASDVTITGTLTVGANADNADVITPSGKNLLAYVFVVEKGTTFSPSVGVDGLLATN